jgi:hypothetical protein
LPLGDLEEGPADHCFVVATDKEKCMMDVIDFLERMGSDAGLRGVTGAGLSEALAEAQIDPLLRKAVLAGDRSRLEFILGAQPNVCCTTHFPESDDDLEEQERKAKEQTKQPERKASAQLSFDPLKAAA